MNDVFPWIFGAVMLLDLAVPFLVAIPYKGYSHLDSTMSVLGCRNSPLRLVYSLWTIVSGIVFVWAGHRLLQAYSEPYPAISIALFLCLALYGIGCEVLSGLFPVNESKGDIDTSTKIHGAGSVVGFVALLFAPLLLGIMALGTGAVGKGIVSLIAFVLALGAMALFIMSDKPERKERPYAHEGLWQRVTMALLYLPFLVWLL